MSSDNDFEKVAKTASREVKNKNRASRKKGANKKSIVVFILGLLVLAVGITMLTVKLLGQPALADAEFLVSSGEWTREDEPSVIWDFTEVGKGKLTTDGGETKYDFIWAIDGGKLKIETSWLYDLDDEFDYNLDQGAKTLTLKNDQTEVVFKFRE